jgi:hypothetical protein
MIPKKIIFDFIDEKVVHISASISFLSLEEKKLFEFSHTIVSTNKSLKKIIIFFIY